MRDHFPEEQIYLSLPDTFDLTIREIEYFSANHVLVLRSLEHLSLSDAISYALDQVKQPIKDFRLLHGDTLISDIPKSLDLIGVVNVSEDYAWEYERVDPSRNLVWCGYFAFSDPRLFRENLQKTEGGFVDAVREYDRLLPMLRQDVGQWYDFGHINTYFQSRARVTTERAFNCLLIADGGVLKTGNPDGKIIAEAHWFKNLPKSLLVFCPQFLDFGYNSMCRPYYSLEYLPLPPLNEIFVHGKNSVGFWSKIFGLCDDFMTLCASQQLSDAQMRKTELSAVSLVKQKTIGRLQDFFLQTEFPWFDIPMVINGNRLPTLEAIIEDCVNRSKHTNSILGVTHGDFCLSNIFYDSRSNRIKVVDPRGLDFAGVVTIMGDLRYDLAKLAHSVIGLYDNIMSGSFELNASIIPAECAFELVIPIDERVKAIQVSFLGRNYIGKLSPHDVLPLTVLLFFSVLPLHSDNVQRQLALFANGLRLYSDFIVNGRYR